MTLTINAFINFNFPLNDSEYFSNVGANSLYSFQMNEGFGIKINSSIIAINYRYIQNYLSRLSRIKEHIVVDLDKGVIMGESFQDDSYDKINKLIDNICKRKSISKNFEETKLFQSINNLYNKLTELSQKKGIYFYKEFIDFNDEPYKDSIDELNKSIQEAFYECVIILSLYFYDNILILE